MTQEYIGDFLSAEIRGEEVFHPLSGYFKTALYYSVEKMIHKICHAFKPSFDDTEGDLSQSCIMYLFSVMGNFDSRRGRFTTFVYWVCRNHLCGLYRATKKRRDVIVTTSEIHEGHLMEIEAPDREMAPVAKDIADTVRVIMRRFPKSKSMVAEIFGNPSEIERSLPDSPNLRGTRRFSTKQRRDFFDRYALPVFQKRFGGVYA